MLWPILFTWVYLGLIRHVRKGFFQKKESCRVKKKGRKARGKSREAYPGGGG